MKLLFVASECAPFIKTGGLADVVGTLPRALAKEGVDVRVILPKYREISESHKREMQHLLHFYVRLGWRNQYVGIETIERDGVTYYFVDNEFYFGREGIYGSGNEEGERFAYFCRAVLESLVHMGFRPDVIHCNDWQTGMVAPLLCMQYQGSEFYRGIKTVFTIHNLRYQGIFAWPHIEDLLGIEARYFTPDMLEYYGCVNFMKAGLVFSDAITTVSPTYAEEIKTAYYGERLDGLLNARANSLVGILNGISTDVYDPENDPVIYSHFSADDLTGKLECKRELRRELGLWQDDTKPILAMITRLVDQKGIDLVERVIDEIMRTGTQMVVLGKGDSRYHDLFGWASWRYGGSFACRIELNENLSHRIYAGADMILVPSQFEPCGLTQMIAMRYGTIPIVRETGGLRDSVEPYNKYTDEGTGFTFRNYNAHEMLHAVEAAVAHYHTYEPWGNMVRRAMKKDFSWAISAAKYAKLYDALIADHAEAQDTGDAEAQNIDDAEAQNFDNAETQIADAVEAESVKAAEAQNADNADAADGADAEAQTLAASDVAVSAEGSDAGAPSTSAVPAEKSPAKKTAAKKTPAKKTPAKKAAAQESPAKKTPAKKTAAKEAPAKKPAAPKNTTTAKKAKAPSKAKAPTAEINLKEE